MALNTNDMAYTQLWIARANGYWAKQGLNVNLVLAGTSTLPMVVSGQADLFYQGAAAAAALQHQGQHVSVIYGGDGGGLAAYVGAQPNIASFNDCRRLGTYLPGSSVFAWAWTYKNLFKTDASITTYSSFPLVASEVANGRMDCSIGSYGVFAPYLKTGQVKILVSPETPKLLPKGFPKYVSEVLLVGLRDNLRAKRPLLVKFLRGIVQARNWMDKTSPKQIAAVVAKQPEFATVDPSVVLDTAKHDAFYWNLCGGYIPKAAWPQTLSWLQTGNIGFDLATPDFSYASMVDMSYLNKAEGPPTKSQINCRAGKRSK